jgi:hypothetical protein
MLQQIKILLFLKKEKFQSFNQNGNFQPVTSSLQSTLFAHISPFRAAPDKHREECDGHCFTRQIIPLLKSSREKHPSPILTEENKFRH